MTIRRLVCAVILFALVLACNARAGIFDDAVNIVTAPIRAPIEATRDVLRGAPPGEIIQNQVNIHVAPQTHVVQSAADVVQRGHNLITQIPRDAIQRNLGNDWLHGYDILTASQRVQFEVAFTSGRFLGHCIQQIQQCGPNQLAAMPLAGAMRDAYRAYVTYSYPLDPYLFQTLGRVVPNHVLVAARWAVGNTPDLTIPGFLNAGHSVFGNQHAVTLGNVMIFSQMPDLRFENGWIWLLHELFHVEQYMRYSSNILESIDGFSVDYIINYQNMEDEAQSNAITRFNVIRNMQ